MNACECAEFTAPYWIYRFFSETSSVPVDGPSVREAVLNNGKSSIGAKDEPGRKIRPGLMDVYGLEPDQVDVKANLVEIDVVSKYIDNHHVHSSL